MLAAPRQSDFNYRHQRSQGQPITQPCIRFEECERQKEAFALILNATTLIIMREDFERTGCGEEEKAGYVTECLNINIYKLT